MDTYSTLYQLVTLFCFIGTAEHSSACTEFLSYSIDLCASPNALLILQLKPLVMNRS